MKVRPEDRLLRTLNTHKGSYQCNRLLYGIASAPAIWHREEENILRKLRGGTVFLDDIKITGATDAEHLERRQAVFKRLREYNIKINLERSEFFKEKINYCGYIIDKYGIHKEKKKMEAVAEMPRPRNTTEVRAFIGLMNYYGRFMLSLSAILYPLNQLLRKEKVYEWTKMYDEAFQATKEVFQSEQMLVHFNPTLSLGWPPMRAHTASGRRCHTPTMTEQRNRSNSHGRR